jgi:hypothetical protein
MVHRKRWKCPNCGRFWDIPIGNDSSRCPKCKPPDPQTSAEDFGEREFQSFYSRFAVDSGESNQESKRPADAEPFFVPLPAIAPETRPKALFTRLLVRKRKKAHSFAFALTAALIVCCVGLITLFVLERPKPAERAATEPEATPEVPGSNVAKEESAITLAEFDSWFGRQSEPDEMLWLSFPGLMEQENRQNAKKRGQMKRVALRDAERTKKWNEIRGRRVTWQGTVAGVVTMDDGDRALLFGSSGPSMLQIMVRLQKGRTADFLRVGDTVAYSGLLDSIVNLGVAVHLNIVDGRIVIRSNPGAAD